MVASGKIISMAKWAVAVSLILALLPTSDHAGEWRVITLTENYCQRCHEPHSGLDLEIQTCQSCHEAVPQGQMELYPWHSSEGAIAGLHCADCHPQAHMDDSCLYCHQRHTDPLRE